jgi:hypothetical protein
MSSGNSFVDRLPPITNNRLPLKPPFSFEGLSARVFPLRANLDSLQRLCNSYLNFIPKEVGRFRVASSYVFLMMLDYGKLAELLSNLGWFAQKEIFFCTPVQWYKVISGKWVFHDWAVFTPFIYVDDDLSVPVGRIVYGWPKTIARLTPTLSRWIEDPRTPISEATLSTMVFPELYSGRRLEERVFMEVERDPTMNNLRYPIDTQAAFAPWTVAANVAQAMAGFGRDYISLLNGLGLFPMNDGSSPDNFIAMMNQFGGAMAPVGPGLISNTLNLKQFRRSDDPSRFCYQALTNGPMRFTALNAMGLFGEERVLAGDVSGGYSIKLYDWPSVPIVETLGLEVTQRWRGEGADVSVVKPVLPFWYDANMEYLEGENLVWRTDDERLLWRDGAGRQLRVPANDSPRAPEDALFNTTVGSAVDALAGPFQFSGTTMRVLPLLARRKTLAEFLDNYINSSLRSGNGDEAVRFSLWAPPQTDQDGSSWDETSGSDVRGDAVAYVYLTATSYGGVLSKTNNIGDWAKFAMTFMIPVKWERRLPNSDDWELVSVGLIPAYSFVDDTTAAVARVEVVGIPTVRAIFVRPESAWMNETGPESHPAQLLLRVNAEVLPALGEGQQSTIRTIIDISQGDHLAETSDVETRVTGDRFASILRDELERKKRTKAAQSTGSNNMKTARTLSLELLGNHVPFAVFTLKQFRDVVDPDKACYQSIVRVGLSLDEVLDVREIEETIRVRIHDFPTQPLVESLGIIGKTVKDDGSGIVYSTVAFRPFAMRVTMNEKLGERLLSRAGTLSWAYDSEDGKPKAFRSILQGDRPLSIGGLAERMQDQGDPRRMEEVARDWQTRVDKLNPLTVKEQPPTSEMARSALAVIDPQMVVESLLSREWGNWDVDARWRQGRRDLQAAYASTLSGVTEARRADAEMAFFNGVYARTGKRPGEPPLTAAVEMIARFAQFLDDRKNIESKWTALAEWGLNKLYGVKSNIVTNTPTQDLVLDSFLGLLDALGSIATRPIIGEPAAPDTGIDYYARDIGARLQEMMTGSLAGIRELLEKAQATQATGNGQRYQTALDAAWLVRDEFRAAVDLARALCNLQREALLNKLSREWQKPDFCIRREIAGLQANRLFPSAESWDDDWYYGPTVRRAPVPGNKPTPEKPAAARSTAAKSKNRSRGHQATRTLSTAFPNSRSRTPRRSATEIRADARAYTPARDGELREKACSTAFPGQPAKAEPSRLCETSRPGPHNRRALQRASPRNEQRSRPIPYGPAAACSARG